ncbi:MAG: hypothetical protein WBB73_15235 [Candidatus Aminicenantaceae bacterium]
MKKAPVFILALLCLNTFGIGLRHLSIRSMGINVGIDVALGKEDTAIYFRILEAF